jgi:hypothetical protein
MSLALKTCSALFWCITVAGSAVAQPARPPARPSEVCYVELTITQTVGNGHLQDGQKFRFVGPITPKNYMIVSPLPGGTAHKVVAGDHIAVKLASGAWKFEWAAPVLSPPDHDPIRVHLYDMEVTQFEEVRPGKKCPSEVVFDYPCHPEDSICVEHPGHATAN